MENPSILYELSMTEQPQGVQPFVALMPDQQTQAMARYEVLQPHLKHGTPLPDLARHSGIALRTLERWLAHYRREGLACWHLEPVHRLTATVACDPPSPSD